EFYLEGNIVFRQGDRVVYADSMYYNVARQYGMILSAEAITPVPEYDGLVRLKADVLQQVASGEFIAFDAAVTTSRMGVPRYWLQSEQLRFSDQTKAAIDPVTGAPVQVSDRVITSAGSFVYVGGVPIFYWPTFSSDITVPTLYVSGIKLKRDSIFGTQALVDIDLFQLFGVDDPPEGVRWTLSPGYLSERGPALGTAITYNRPSFLGLQGPASGFLDAWGIRDTGLDVLGRDRRDLVPEQEYRGRVLGRHRQWLAYDYEMIAEVGYLSDRNFLEQYFENEYDRNKDHDTSLRLRKYYFNNLFELSAEAQANDFYTETQRLPSFDHYLIGGSLLGDRLTWSMHNQVGYADLNVAQSPTDPVQDAITQTPLPGEVDAEGVIAATRQEISMPLELGPLKLIPFLSGEASHYGEDVSGESLTRLIGQSGLRTALPMWRVDPNIQSSLLNVRGLAHKVEFTGEYFYANSDTDLDQLPLYDPLDDDAQEEFRRRFFFSTFGGGLPARFDPRNYAYRQGLQRYVTSPSEVIADDAMQARLGVHQRWQTKRGVPGRERIVDLMRFDVDTVLFPEADRDNFGETIGPTTYDFRYHLGDRVTLLSDGYADFFEDGLRSVSAGVRTSRPGLGDVYLGLMSLEGPISATVLRSSYDYRLNEKWIYTASSTYDFGETGNVGQTFALTRIGESLLVRMGIDIDEGRDNIGFVFAVEPRFFPSRSIGSLGGQLIPPPGIEGLE
ncbi:MAG: organic solvent tolerance protein OstA, partial [Planctomycetaceae bacterium]